MLKTLAVANYRSINKLVIPLGRLNLITGPNGSGKSNLYRALRLLAETAQGGVINALAREGGLDSTFWAGPETISRRMRNGEVPIEATVRQGVKRLRLAMEMLGETATDIKKLNRHAGNVCDLRRKGRERVGQGGSIGTLVIDVKTVGARKRMEADDWHVGLGQCNRRQQGVLATHAEVVRRVFARADQLARVQAQNRLRRGLFADDANQSLRLLQAVDDERAA